MTKSYISALRQQVSIALLLSLLAVSSYFVWTHYRSDLEYAKENNRLKAQAIALSLEQRLFYQLTLLDTLARRQVITELPLQIEYSQAAVKEMQRLVENSSYVSSLVIDNNGELVEAFPASAFKLEDEFLIDFALTQLNNAEINQAPRIFYLAQSEKLKNLFLTNIQDSYLIVIAPLIAPSRSFFSTHMQIGAVIGVLSVKDTFAPVIEASNLPPNSRYDLSLNHYSLLHPSNQQQNSDQPLMNYLSDAVNFTHIYTSHTETSPLTFSLNTPEKYYLADVYESLLVMLVVISVCLTVSYFFVDRLLKRLTKPLHQVIETGEQFAKGKYSVANTEYIYDEFNTINRVLNKMAKTINEQLKQITIEKERALESDKLKSQFLANMSHEIRTPINSVVGFVQVLEESPLTNEQKLSITRIKRSCFLLLNIINDILDLSKIEENKMELNYEPCNLAELVSETVELFMPNCEDKEIQLNLIIDKPFPQQLLCDEIRLKQIVTNLVANAVKFTDQGSITVSLQSQQQSDDLYQITIKVKDTGIGISSDIQKILFSPFVQADGKTSRKFGGTGLGLSICRHLVELMNGSISVVSELGKGAEFRVTLPLKKIEVEQLTSNIKPVRENYRELHGKSILIAEDNVTNQLVLKALLQPLNLNLDFANNGIEACAKCRNNHYDAILMDVQMPEMDGIEATQIILQQSPSFIPIIGVSANAMLEDLHTAKEAGMVAYIAKPIIKEELYQTLSQWLKR
jgi:signal transduction histidine kinase